MTSASGSFGAPLSLNELSFWLDQRLDPASIANNVTEAMRLRGHVDLDASERAVEQLVERHEILRAIYVEADGVPRRVIQPIDSIALHVEDAATWTDDEVTTHLSRLAAEPFALSTGPLFRVTILRRSASEHVLVLAFHHIITDMWSVAVVINEFLHLYRRETGEITAELPPARASYADHVDAQRTLIESPKGAEMSVFWRRQLAHAHGVLDLPFDRPRHLTRSGHGASASVAIGVERTDRIRELASERGTTPFALMLAAFQVLLHRYTGNDDIVVGSPKANRSARSARVVGCYLNPIVLRTDLSDDPSFVAAVDRCAEVVKESFARDRYPLHTVIEDLAAAHEAGGQPLFNTMFAWQKTSRLVGRDFASAQILNQEKASSYDDGLHVESMAREWRATPLDLTLLVAEVDRQLVVTFEYATDLFEAGTVERLADHFVVLLESALADPEQTIGALPMLTETERGELTSAVDDTRVEYDRDVCVHTLVTAQARRTPSATAVTFTDESLTYRQLDERANQLAHHLIARGVTAGDIVGIHLDRGLDMVVAVLATLKAGAAYLPLDPGFPPERLEFMRADSAAATVITTTALAAGDPAAHLDITAAADAIAAQPSSDPAVAVSATDLAYVIYTSGSTGRPKGVQIEHRNVVNFLHAMTTRPGITPADTLLSVTTLSFDVAAGDIFLPLINGATLVVASTEAGIDPQLMLAELDARRPTLMQATATTWRMLIDAGWRGDPDLTIVCGGEALTRDLADELLTRCAILWNAYGPTEATVCAAMGEVRRDEVITIGRALDNTTLLVLDRYQQPLPLGVPGELFIGGDGVARGYLDRPELTAERFVPDPHQPGQRLYRTGDLARRLPTGDIELLGRLDNQVKIRGHRIELGEIEAHLTTQPAITQALVTTYEPTPGNTQLLAYYTHTDTPPTDSDLRAKLRANLPDYMVPTTYVALDTFPLTPNKKIDRNALPTPTHTIRHTSEPPRPGIETTIATIWENVLGTTGIGRHDNFFDLGGHSLLATMIVSRLRDQLGLELAVRTIFVAPTIAELAAKMGQWESIAPGSSSVIAIVDRTRPLELSLSQERMWFLHQLHPTATAYNLAGALRLKGPLDVEALRWSFDRLVERHESLRTYFHVHEGRAAQSIVAPYPVAMPLIDCQTGGGSGEDAAFDAMVTASNEPFDLGRLPLFRSAIYRVGDEEHLLFLSMHHIISDQWSFGVMSTELSTIYAARCAGEPDPLPPLPLQHVDYVAWHRSWLETDAHQRQLEYWKEQLAGLPVLDMPSDRVRPAVQSMRGASVIVPLSAELAALTAQLSRQHHASPFMVFLAAFLTLLHRYSGASDLAVGSPIANRNWLESEHLISSFVNTLVLRVDVSGDPTFSEVVDRVQATTLDAYAHQDLPFDRLVEELRPPRDLSRSPLFQVFFNLQNAPMTLPALAGLTVEALPLERRAAQFDLSLSVDTSWSNSLVFEYATDLFEAGTVERLADHFVVLLESALADPEQTIGALPMLTETERGELTSAVDDTRVEYDRDVCVHTLVTAQARRTPSATAVTFTDESLTYRQLDERANQLAHHLIARGVTAGDIVGIHLDRGLDMVVAVLATLKAGAAYLPLDPGFPPERLEFMRADSAAATVITTTALAAGDPAAHLDITAAADAIAAQPSSDPAVAVSATDLAYVIYTSGSTGRPKGVQIEHRNVVNFLHAMTTRPGITPADTLLSVTTLSFDISVLELFLPLINGARVVVVDRASVADGYALIDNIARVRPTLMQATPTTWRMLIDAGWRGDPDLTIVCGGEALTRDLADELLTRCAILWNAYGPTETTVWSSIKRIESGEPITIGRALDNTTLLVLDRYQQPLPLGVPGELFIGGDGVARGYLDRPELTAERFVPDPHQPGQRLYRTGDLARRLPTGDIELLGRLDNQVKIRGHRIELGEIEAHLTTQPAITQALVTTYEPTPGNTQLLAYYTHTDTPPTDSDLRAKLRANLPDYMVPTTYVALDTFPLTPNKKIDRNALPTPTHTIRHTSEPPRPGIETTIATIWENVLGTTGIGRHDNFFDLGGHSLLAIRVFAKIEETTGKSYPLTKLFQVPTVSSFAGMLYEEGWRPPWTSQVAVQPDGSQQPLFVVAPFLITALSFNNLARHLGDEQPLYVFQPQGMDTNDPTHTTVRHMAAHYISEMRQVQRTGPYRIGGHCAGSWVAFEMVRQLQHAGDEVDLLFLVDSEPPGIQPPKRGRIRHVASRVVHYAREGRLLDAIRWRLGVAYERMLAASAEPKHDRQRVAAVRRKHAEAHGSYRGGRIAGDALFLRSEESASLADKDWHLRWAEVIDGTVTVVLIPGTHAALLESPNAEAMAKVLGDAIGALDEVAATAHSVDSDVELIH